jgi:hypothetical protein
VTDTPAEAAKRAAKPHHIVIGDKPFSAFARTKAGKAVIAAAGVDSTSVFDSEMAAKKVVRALRAHLKDDEGAVIRGHAKIVEGAEPKGEMADA